MNKDKDLRCYTVHHFFEIKDAELYGGIGSTGYAEISLEKAINISPLSIKNFNKYSESLKRGLSEQLNVPVGNITAIHRNKYEEHTEEPE